MVPDAQRLPWRPVDTGRAVTSPSPRVWVHLDGAWRAGAVVFWERSPGGEGWDVWLQHDSLEYPDTAWSEHHWYRYSPRTVRPRTGEETPGE